MGLVFVTLEFRSSLSSYKGLEPSARDAGVHFLYTSFCSPSDLGMETARKAHAKLALVPSLSACAVSACVTSTTLALGQLTCLLLSSSLPVILLFLYILTQLIFHDSF